MKKAIVTFIILIPVYCSAQFEKLILFTSGSGSFTSQTITQDFNGTSASTKNSNFTLSPKVGVFVIDKLLVGPTFSVSFSKSKALSSNIETKSQGFSGGPFIRYYIFHGLYAQADYVWGKSKSDAFSFSSGANITTESTSNLFTTGAGYSVFLNPDKSVALDISLAYRNRIQKPSPANSLSVTRYEESGLIVSIGVSGFIHLLSTK